MMEKNCMNCPMAVGKVTANGHKKWHCKLNGFTVNARMSCEEWCGWKFYDGFGTRVDKAMRIVERR